MSHKLLAPFTGCCVALALSVSAASAAGAASPSRVTAAAPRYTYTDLGVLGGLDSHAWTLNSHGRVIGHADTSPNSGPGGFHAFLWTPTTPNGTSGAMVDLGTLRGDGNSTANGINAASLVVGESLASDFGTSHAYVYNGSMHDLGGFGGQYSAANGINSGGAITGYSKLPDGFDHAFLWIPDKPDGVRGKMHDLGTLPGRIESVGAAINDGGTIVGASLDPDFIGHAFIWQPAAPNAAKGSMAEMPEPSGTIGSGATAVNRDGLVVGSMLNGAGQEHAFSYDAALRGLAIMRDLGTLPGGTTSVAYSINSSGAAVGFADTGAQAFDHAVLFTDGRVIDLNRLLPASAQSAGVVLTVAFGINDSGQIAGYATVGGHARGFLLTPAR
jgi:probable HAF family extracellular repeat protein